MLGNGVNVRNTLSDRWMLGNGVEVRNTLREVDAGKWSGGEKYAERGGCWEME